MSLSLIRKILNFFLMSLIFDMLNPLCAYISKPGGEILWCSYFFLQRLYVLWAHYLRQLPTHSSRFTVPLIESFQELTNAYINFNILARNSIHYYGGYVAFKFLNVHNCMYCENALTIDKPNNVSRDYQLFTAMKGYSPDSIFSNLKVCTDPYYKLMTYLEHNFNDAFNQYKMKPRVGELIFCYYVYQLGCWKIFAPVLSGGLQRVTEVLY